MPLTDAPKAIDDLDFDFENREIRIAFVRECGAFAAAGKNWGPFSSGQEADLPYWVAQELVGSRVARFRDEDRLDLATLSKAHWRETIPTSRQLPALDPWFYPKLRRLLEELKIESRSDPSKGRDYEKALNLSKDILNCRIRKLVSMSAAPPASQELTTSMTNEERLLYGKMGEAVLTWKKKILGPEV